MMATQHEEKNKAGSMGKSISIIIAALALIVSVVLGWLSYNNANESKEIARDSNDIATKSNEIARESKEIAKQIRDIALPKFRLYNYKSRKLGIEESISTIDNLCIVPSELVREVEQRLGTEAEGEERFYLWVIIENLTNTATNLNLISIKYTFTNEKQILLRSGRSDRRWPDLPAITAPREAFAILMHTFSDNSELKGFDKFEVEIEYSVGEPDEKGVTNKRLSSAGLL